MGIESWVRTLQMATSIWPITSERSTTYRFLVDLGTGIPLLAEDPVMVAVTA